MKRFNEKLEEDDNGKFTIFKDEFHLNEEIYKLQAKCNSYSIIIAVLITIIVEIIVYFTSIA